MRISISELKKSVSEQKDNLMAYVPQLNKPFMFFIYINIILYFLYIVDKIFS